LGALPRGCRSRPRASPPRVGVRRRCEVLGTEGDPGQSDKDVQPYDGDVWSWSPSPLNRIAYVDGKGGLWIARADRTNAQSVAKGSFTLPPWSEDGRLLAIVERKENGARWDVSITHLPQKFRE